jgi:zinc transporter
LVLNDLATLVERIKLLQEELAAKLNEQTNRPVHPDDGDGAGAAHQYRGRLFWHECGGVPLANHPHGFGCWWRWWPPLPCWLAGGPLAVRRR